MLPGGENPVQVQFVPPHARAKAPTPLVLIHDGGGTVFGYFLLGSLDRDVWALWDPMFFDGEAWAGGIDEMARHYIDLLVKAGLSGRILLGGWSLGGLLALVMAHMLAQDPSAPISIAGILNIDSPYHGTTSKPTLTTSVPKIEGVNDLVKKSFEHCDAMLERWDLPSWQGPSGGGKAAKVRVSGRSFTIQPGTTLLKPLEDDWHVVGTCQFRHEEAAGDPLTPPPGVLIRCTRPSAKVEGSGPGPTPIDVHRDAPLLGWEGHYTDFLLAVIDVDDDHYRLFDRRDETKISNLTLQLNAGLEILDSLSY